MPRKPTNSIQKMIQRIFRKSKRHRHGIQKTPRLRRVSSIELQKIFKPTKENQNPHPVNSLPESKDEINPNDYVMVDLPKALTSSGRYHPCHMNAIAIILLEKQGFTLTSVNSNVSIATKDQKKIAVFKVVKDTNTKEVEGLLSLEAALTSYQELAIPCDTLIIPVGEIVRNHYRLLCIFLKENKAIFFDSKSSLVSQTSSLISPALDSLNLAVHDSAPENENVVAKLSMFAANVVTKYKDNYFYLAEICKKYFPHVEFSEQGLGHQGLLNHEDCGTLTLEYMKEIIAGNFLTSDLAIDIVESRTWQCEYHEEWMALELQRLQGISFRV